MPDEFRHADRKPKGVANRMKGLEVLLRGSRNNGVIYFADDDNTYHLQLFDEARLSNSMDIYMICHTLMIIDICLVNQKWLVFIAFKTHF